MHTVRYWDKKLLSLQRLSDSVGYDIDNDPDYLNVCQLLPVSRNKPAPVEILPFFCKVVERVQKVCYHARRNGNNARALLRHGRYIRRVYFMVCCKERTLAG